MPKTTIGREARARLLEMLRNGRRPSLDMRIVSCYRAGITGEMAIGLIGEFVALYDLTKAIEAEQAEESREMHKQLRKGR